MLAAQGYQESRPNQDVQSPGGGAGIMQVTPEDAAASPINITDVTVLTNNIHAGAKMLRNIADTHFNDPNIDSFNRALFSDLTVEPLARAGPPRMTRCETA